MASHSFVFASLDGQAIGIFAIHFRRECPGENDRRGSNKEQAKQSSPAEVEALYH
ncbi:MAG: hypothetical protein WBM45_15935 [Woeseiaceae bacterium]